MQLIRFCKSLGYSDPKYEFNRTIQSGGYTCVINLSNGARFQGATTPTQEAAAESAASIALHQLGATFQPSTQCHPQMVMHQRIPTPGMMPHKMPQSHRFHQPQQPFPSAFRPVQPAAFLMATAIPLCDVCQLQNISKQAEVWCSECEEAICGECDDLHSLRKLTKNHKTISIRDYQNLPRSALEIKHHCSAHEEKYEFYCTNHVSPCCVKCVKEDHKKCEIDSLRDVVQNIKSSSSVTNIEQNVSEIQSIFQKIKDEKRSNLKYIEEKTTTYQKEIADRRKQINVHLDFLELEMNKNLEDKQKEVKTSVEGFISIIDSKIKHVEKAISNINQMKSHATDLQVFLALREIEKDVEKELSYIKDLTTKPKMKVFDVQLTESDGLKSMQKDVGVWGEISIKTFDSLVCTEVTTEKQAQMILPSKRREYVTDINSIKLQKNTSFKVQSEKIRLTGCELLPGGEILLVNKPDKTILMYNKSGSRIKEFKQQWEPNDITYIGNDMIAISCRKEMKVCTLNTANEQLETIYKSPEKVYGIAYKDGKLFLCYGIKGIRIIAVSGTLISDIQFNSNSTLHLCVGRSGQIYYPIWNDKSVVCCDSEGNIKWTTTNDSMTKVLSITCGLNDVVFAADYSGTTVISSDGKHIKRILDKSSGLNQPRGIHFSDKRNQLLVCNEVGQVFLYDVQ